MPTGILFKKLTINASSVEDMLRFLYMLVHGTRNIPGIFVVQKTAV